MDRRAAAGTAATPFVTPAGAHPAPAVFDRPEPPKDPMENAATVLFTRIALFTDADGRARFREEPIELAQGTPAARLSVLTASGGYQLRMSPVGFRSEFHCTTHPQWVFILQGRMEIGLQDGSARSFGPGEHFFSVDVLPDGAAFDSALHGHRSRQLGDEPLVTLFVRG